MRGTFKAMWIGGLGLVVLFASYWLYLRHAGGELNQKDEWSLLQAIEYKNRETTCEKAKILNHAMGTGFNVVGLQEVGGRCVWVLLNPAGSPLVKAMPPDSDLRISREDLNEIGRLPAVNVDVLRYLQSHAQP